MLRRATAVVFMLILTPELVRAQETVLRVSVPSADVHKGPSVVTPVIGQAARGTALTVSQNLGSWVKVPWPAAPDGVGYVHVTMGQFVSATGQPITGMSSRSSTTGSVPGSLRCRHACPLATRSRRAIRRTCGRVMRSGSAG